MIVRIEGEELVVRVTLDAIAHNTKFGPALDGIAYDADGEPRRIDIIDLRAWAKGVAQELRRDSEDGTTLLHLAFDKAIINAFEAGADGIRIDGVTD